MKTDIYETTTQRIIAEMQAGVLPWARPWHGASAGMPVNALSGRKYSGVNVLQLWAAGQNYSSPRWLTFKQAKDAGASVRGGEKGTMIFYADKFIPAAEKVRAAASGENAKAIPFLKSFYVFNAEQCDGLPVDESTPRPVVAGDVSADAEACIAATGAVINHGGDRAYYRQATDSIQLPPRDAFATHADYYATTFHELGHWTGHKDRLARDFGAKFGDSAYAREELVAEMAAAFACASFGISPQVRHADYLAAWLQILKEDNRAIFRAASLASKAADYVLGAVASPVAVAA